VRTIGAHIHAVVDRGDLMRIHITPSILPGEVHVIANFGDGVHLALTGTPEAIADMFLAAAEDVLVPAAVS